MLSRTADNLFWMCRYMERAEHTARMLDVNLQMSLLPQDDATRAQLWRALLRISELQESFDATYPDGTPQDVLRFMVRDPDNPSSIYTCLRAARENARAVRGSLTTEVWETYNATWLELIKHLHIELPERNPREFCEWVKFRSHIARGVSISTMLQDEALYFMRIGMHLERADNTARMLDVRFHEFAGLAETGRHEGQRAVLHNEFYHWAAILNSVSGLEVYRKVYRDVITPGRVAELLILRPDMPRSLLASMIALERDLAHVGNARSAETQRRAGMLCAELRFERVDDILQKGLHRYLERFLAHINDLGNRISQDFLVPLSA
jgi:uncharacterized alpha-E superfamily protein